MAKFYAVARGKSKKAKILNTWDECKKEVIGAKGAIYKSFGNREDAINFIRLHGIEFGEDLKEENLKDNEVSGLKVYVDGSFMVHKNNYSYGLVVVDGEKVLYEDNGVGSDKDAIALRNVSGEVMGAKKAVEYAMKNKFKEVTIFFDYQGIESWAIGTWKRNNKITKEYNEFMKEKMKNIKINFKKVKGHSGDKFNDLADKLAKEALDEI